MKKFKKNRWYISIPKGYALVCYQGKNKPSYGFNFSGKWTEEFNLNTCKRGDFNKATYNEVYLALQKEADKRGLIEGIYVECAETPSVNSTILSWEDMGFQFDKHRYDMYVRVRDVGFYYASLFFNGKWAKVL